MEFSGNQKIKASCEQVFNALLDTNVLKASIPGCEVAEFVDTPEGRQLKLVITTPVPGFKGPYNVLLQISDVVAPSHLVLIAEPTSDFGTIRATCAIDLASDPQGTSLVYNAQSQATGKIAAIPEMIIKASAKSTIDKFFSNFEKQVSAQQV